MRFGAKCRGECLRQDSQVIADSVRQQSRFIAGLRDWKKPGQAPGQAPFVFAAIVAQAASHLRQVNQAAAQRRTLGIVEV